MTLATDAKALAPVGASAEEPKAAFTVGQLMWLRFRRNKLALTGVVILSIIYVSMIFADFIAPYGVDTTHELYTSASPNGLHLIDAQGKFHWPPFVYGFQSKTNLDTLRKTYSPNTDEIYPLGFFAAGEPYMMFGLIPTTMHLFSVADPGKVFLLGTDSNGHDLFSRVLYGSRVSLTVGLVGVLLSVVLGAFIGVVSGYYGGVVDTVVQRIIEVISSIPQIPLWLGLAAAVPPDWSPIGVYFGIAVVLSLVTWGGLARQVRGIVLSLRETDFVMAARYTNCSTFRIITRHLLPNTFSHVLVIATLAIPGMILGETSLSFLGLGIRAPMTSWGVLLTEAQRVRVLIQEPWVLWPAVFVLLTVVSFNFVGDGLRDAADPFAGE
jgi:peptide/nickel transport system permease protein